MCVLYNCEGLLLRELGVSGFIRLEILNHRNMNYETEYSHTASIHSV